jgi:hypothetical protein
MLEPDARGEITTLLTYFRNFLLNPIEALKNLPLIKWQNILATQALCAVFVALIVLFFNRDFESFFFLFALPIILVFVTALLTLSILGYFRLFESRDLAAQKLHTLTTVATLPYLVGFPLYRLLPPLMLVTSFACGAALVTGLVENFEVSRAKAIQIVGFIISIFVILWIINRIVTG